MIYLSGKWSDYLVTVSLASILVAIFIKIITIKRNKYILPSGPRGIPLLGNILSVVKTPLHLKLSEWANEFGDIYTIHLGHKAAVVVNDVAKMKEIFSIFPGSTGKLLTDTFKLAFAGKYGVLCVDGDVWAEQRQFCVKSLRTFGFGKGSTMEPIIIDEVNDLVSWVKKEGTSGRPMILMETLQKAAFNVVWTLVTGVKISPGDSRLLDLMQQSMIAVQRAVRTGLAFVPWLKYIAPEMSGYNCVHKVSTDINHYIREYFEEHQSSLTDGSPRDLIDAYLEQMKKEKDPKSSFYGEEGWKHSVGSVVTLFFGGGETTATTLNWLIFYLCCDQKVQRKLHEEIDRVIGKDREPCLKDKSDMPYTEAVILETLRKSTIIPFGLAHEFTEETRFNGYIVPKGVILLANLYHAHYNQKTWGDPENFRPERFLTGDKNLKDNVVAFQVGKRQCLGESLARDVMFMFVATLFQNFHFNTDPAIAQREYLEPDIGLFLTTKHLPVVVSSRVGA